MITTAIQKLVGSLIRKLVFGTGAMVVAFLVDQGLLADADIEKIVAALIGLAMMAVAALWTYVKERWIV